MRAFQLFLLAALPAAAQTFTGNWTFTGQSSVFGLQFTATGQITQAGISISGRLAISGNPCATSGALTGTISGSKLNAAVNENGALVNFTGTIAADSNSASGTYQAPPFGCTNGDQGTWTAARQTLKPTITGITSAASFQYQIGSGSYVSLFGSGLSDKSYIATPPYPTILGNTQVTICPTNNPATLCRLAQMQYASPSQVNIVTPSIQDGSNDFTVKVNGVASAPVTEYVPFYWPSIFLAGRDCPIDPRIPGANANCGLFPAEPPSNTRMDRGIVTDLSGNIVWSGNPARLGQSYTAWVTGLGPITGGTNPKPSISMVFIDVPAYGYPNPSYGIVKVLYAGAVTQFPGLYQINFQIPLSIGMGPDGYGSWPCGDYSWELTLTTAEGSSYASESANQIKIPLVIKSGDVACKP